MGCNQSLSLHEEDDTIHTNIEDEEVKPLKKCNTCTIWFNQSQFSKSSNNNICNECYHQNPIVEEDIKEPLVLNEDDKVQCDQCNEWKIKPRFIQTRKGFTRTYYVRHTECNQCRLFNKRQC